MFVAQVCENVLKFLEYFMHLQLRPTKSWKTVDCHSVVALLIICICVLFVCLFLISSSQ